MSMKLPFFRRKKKKNKDDLNQLNDHNLPIHVAVIMDGNGRWAKKRGLPRIAGHKEGMDIVKDIVMYASKRGIKVLTLYAFSTENWKRPKPEVDYLMRLPKEFLHVYLPDMIENNVKIETVGDFEALPKHTKKAVNYAKEKTKDNDGLLVNFALNYGSRTELTRVVQLAVAQAKNNELCVDEINEAFINELLYTKGIPEPDLLIRTSGEKRLSNFLLWQLAYTELWFTETLWPDFTADKFEEAIQDYQNRKRRFGGV